MGTENHPLPWPGASARALIHADAEGRLGDSPRPLQPLDEAKRILT
jgi:hypothetical protein